MDMNRTLENLYPTLNTALHADHLSFNLLKPNFFLFESQQQIHAYI